MALSSRTLLCNHRRPLFVTPPWNSVPINHRLPFPSSPALGDHHATLRLLSSSTRGTSREWNGIAPCLPFYIWLIPLCITSSRSIYAHSTRQNFLSF